jgi:hypothetical protein
MFIHHPYISPCCPADTDNTMTQVETLKHIMGQQTQPLIFGETEGLFGLSP